MAKPENFDIQVIIDYLQGTCNTIDEALQTHYEDMEFEDLSGEDHDAIDNQIFLCATCGWWNESHTACPKEECEDNHEQHCEDCCEEED